MTKRLKIFMTLLLLTAGKTAYCQAVTDTGALIKEFNKVMSFTVQPYLYYTTVTRLSASPVMNAEDTMRLQGVFYKNGNDLYYSNGQEETYLQDSLYIQINSERKTIWISKVDMDSKDKLNVLPLSNTGLQEIFRRNFSVVKTIAANNISRLSFETKQKTSGRSIISTVIGIEYTSNDHIPKRMDMETSIQETAAPELQAALKEENINIAPLMQTIDGIQYLVRKQQVIIEFDNIDNARVKAMQLPSWKDKLQLNAITAEYNGKGIYKDYEVTKTF